MMLLGKNKEVTDAMEKLWVLSNQEVPMVAAVILAMTTKTFQNMQAITGWDSLMRLIHMSHIHFTI